MILSIVVLSIAPPKFELTIESIMRGPALVGHAPRSLRWSPDGSELRFSWAKADGSVDPSYKEYAVKRDGTGLAPVGNRSNEDRPEEESVSVQDGQVYELDGDIYYKTKDGATTRITETPEREEAPRLARDGKVVVYVLNGNLFRIELADKSKTQLTEFKNETLPAGSNPPDSKSQAALAKNQSELFSTFPSSGTIRRPPSSPGSLGPSYVGYHYRSYAISPGGTHAIVQLTKDAPAGRVSEVPNYITRSGYSDMISTYAKVGEEQPESNIVIVDLANGKKLDFAQSKPSRAGGLRWSPDQKRAVAWVTSNDNKDAWLMGFDPATDTLTTIWNEHDEAWIGGPGRGVLGWLPDSSQIYFQSEKTGYSHLMLASPNSSEVRALTSGPFEVFDLRLDQPYNRFIFVSSEGSPFKRHIDSIGLDGSNKTKLADYSADEDASFAIAPNGKDIAVVRSVSNRPAELFVNGVQVTTTPTEEWLSGPWIDPPVVMIPARDGEKVPARFFKPKKWKAGGPAVLFVHGAGYLQNVYDGWSHYFREYMFHHVLMDRGYAVLDMDYRGSAGYGKAWRTGIYRHMGGKDLTDEVDGVNWLVKEQGVNPKRVGLYGGSYGGFITLMAMFTTPDVFAAGAALRPVSDWANYNHGYTSDILNLPQDDPVAYRQSSPIYFAEGLKGALLICHGMVDTNVHFQDSVRLIERLIELGKTNWQVAPYPIEDHAFTKAASWTDEYRRILELFEREIGSGWKRR